MAHDIVTVTNKGRITLPANVRRAMHLAEESQLQVAIEGDAIILRPVVMIPREDAWAYTPEHRAHVECARAEPGFAASEEELRAVIESDDPTVAAQRLIAARRNG